MKSDEKNDVKNLYLFQDAVAKRINNLKAPFYLGGGTAVARCYFNHRYSDDLEFHVDADADFQAGVQLVAADFEKAAAVGDFSIENIDVQQGDESARIFLKNSAGVELLLTFVDSRTPHFGAFTNHPRLGRVDSWQNILSNLLVALPNGDIRDFVDAWIIAKNSPFEWSEILDEARQKDGAVDPAVVAGALKNIPVEQLDRIRWIYSFDKEKFLNDVNKMAADARSGATNSIFSVGWIC